MSNVFATIEEDAKALFEKHTFLELKSARYGIQDLSDYDVQVLDRAIDMHRKSLRDKLNDSSIT